MAEHHTMMGGKLHIYRRVDGGKWQCATYLNGRNWRVSSGEESLSHAKDFAEDWFFELKGKKRAGMLKTGRTFKEAAERFLIEYDAMTEGDRSPAYVESLDMKLRVHLLPFFGSKLLSEVTAGLVQDYRVHRATAPKDENDEPVADFVRPARSTLHHEIVTLRHVLKTASRHGWISHIPDMSAPYKTSGKIGHRAWFSPEQYKQLYKATRSRVQHPKSRRWQKDYENLHDYVLFMVNTGLRPDEAKRLQFRDVAIVTDKATCERILEIEVRGKRGVGYCKSMPGAVLPFERVKTRKSPEGKTAPEPNALVFGRTQRELFNAILTELDLKFDRDGNRRSAYSLRHTYICFRLMEGADIYQIAKNCRTSVEMIEKFYAKHIKNQLDAAAINVRKLGNVMPEPARSKVPSTRRSRQQHKVVG